MPKPKIVILEDEFFAAQHLLSLVNSLGYNVVNTYHSGEDFLKKTDWNFDAAILDLFLSKTMTGLQVASHVKERGKPFIFLTANQDSITLREAARLSPEAYISKPFHENDIEAALEIISYGAAPKLKIRGAHGLEFLNVSDILFIKGDGAYVDIFTIKGMIVQRKLLKEIELELPGNFLRIHRSYLVNENYIDSVAADSLKIKETKIPISRSYRDQLDFLDK